MKPKFLKLLGIGLLLGLLATLALPTVSRAQTVPGLYQFQAGGNVVIPALTTNVFWVYPTTNGVPTGVIITNTPGLPGSGTNLVLNVSQFDYAGLTITLTGTATSTNTFLLYKSMDNGATYEANATFQYTNIAPGAASFTTNAYLDLHGVTQLALVSKSTGTTFATNALVELNLKSSLILSTQPGNYGKTPGTPISVPNFGP